MSKPKPFTLKTKLVALEIGAGRVLAFPRFRHDGTHARIDNEENPREPGFYTPHTKDPKRGRGRRAYDFVHVSRSDVEAWYDRIRIESAVDWLFATQPIAAEDGARWYVRLPKQAQLLDLFVRHFGGMRDIKVAHLISFWKDFRRSLREGNLIEVRPTRDLAALTRVGVVGWNAAQRSVVLYRFPLFATRVDGGSEQQFALSFSSDGLLWHGPGWYATPTAHSKSLFARIIAPTLGPRFRSGLQRLLSIFRMTLDWAKFDQATAAIAASGPPPNLLAKQRWCAANATATSEPTRTRLVWLGNGRIAFAFVSETTVSAGGAAADVAAATPT